MCNVIQDPDNPNVQFVRRVRGGLLEDVKITTTENVNTDDTTVANQGLVEIRTVTKTIITETRILQQNG